MSDRMYLWFTRTLVLLLCCCSVVALPMAGWFLNEHYGTPHYVYVTLTQTTLSYQTITQPQPFTVTMPTIITFTERSVWTVTERSIVAPTYVVVMTSATATVSGGSITPTGPVLPAGSTAWVTFTHRSWNTSVLLQAILVDIDSQWGTSATMRYDPGAYNPYLPYRYTLKLGVTAGKHYAIIVKRLSTTPELDVLRCEDYLINTDLSVTVS